MNKGEYLSPEADVIEVQMAGIIAASGELDYNDENMGNIFG